MADRDPVYRLTTLRAKLEAACDVPGALGIIETKELLEEALWAVRQHEAALDGLRRLAKYKELAETLRRNAP